jgi:serine/threonine-protein kinase HipA
MASECFVYIVLPGATEFVTAGKFELSTDSRGASLGRFVYGRSYLERSDAVPLDPVELTLSRGTVRTAAMKGVFGALRDAGPDYWGRRVIEKHLQVASPGEMDYLLQSADDRAGALGFGLNQAPPSPRRKFNRTLDLAKLQAVADALVRDEEVTGTSANGQIEGLLLLGTSMGGARPKAVVEDDDGLWLAKFNCTDDPWNCARVEHAMLVLARTCGIKAAQSKVVQVGRRDVLLVKRFDREKMKQGYRRARMVSALTLLRAQDSHLDRDKWSYVSLVEQLRRASAAPSKDAPELFRRMCFNALISNTDDHPRNHAMIAWSGEWELSPAYDLTPTAPVSIERRDLALTVGDMGRYAHADNLLSQCARFLIEPEEARSIISRMEKRVRDTWHKVARAEGVTQKDCDKIKGAFAYPGFRLEVESVDS